MDFVTEKEIHTKAQEWVKEHFKGLAGETQLDVFKYDEGKNVLPYECAADWLCAFYRKLVEQGIKSEDVPEFRHLYNVCDQEVMALGRVTRYIQTDPYFYHEWTAYLFSFGDMDVLLCETQVLGNTK